MSMLQSPPTSLRPFLPHNLQPPQPVSIQLIDIRMMNPLPINSLVEAVKKTGRMVIVHEAGKSGGVGNNIAGEVSRRAFEYLEAPIGIVSGWE